MKKEITLIIALLWTFTALGQQKLEPLKIGDIVPNLKSENLLNHPKGEIQLSDYKGKLLILDFWATWCSPCVASFPKLDSLDKAYGDDLAILPVTYQSKEEVEKLFSKMARLKDIKKPMIYGDDNLRSIFPHNSLPYYVWIDQEGKVVAFTSGEEINSENLEKAILADFSKVRTDQQQANRFDRSLPIRDQLNQNDTIKFQSNLWSYLPGFPSLASPGNYYDEGDDNTRIFFTNVLLVNLYRHAYRSSTGPVNPKNVEIQAKSQGYFSDITKFTQAERKDWIKSGNVFSYELEVSPKYKDQIWEIFKSDLRLLFPQYKAELVIKQVPAKALVKISDVDIKSKGGEPIDQITPYEAIIQNKSIKYLTGYLNLKYLQHLDEMIIDQSGIEYPVDISFECNMTNLEEIRKALKPYGLDLIDTMVDQEILLIDDNH